jgi:hypothetical protein
MSGMPATLTITADDLDDFDLVDTYCYDNGDVVDAVVSVVNHIKRLPYRLQRRTSDLEPDVYEFVGHPVSGRFEFLTITSKPLRFGDLTARYATVRRFADSFTDDSLPSSDTSPGLVALVNEVLANNAETIGLMLAAVAVLAED